MKTEVKVQRLFHHSGHEAPIYALEKGADSIFFSGSADGVVALWDSQTAKDAIGLMKAKSAIYCLHYIPELNYLAVGLSDGLMYVVDIENRKIVFSKQKHLGAIYGIQHIENELYSVGQDGKLIVTNLTNGENFNQVLLSHKNLRFLQILEQKIISGGGEGILFEIEKDGLGILQKWQVHHETIFDGLFIDENTFLTVGKDAHLKRLNLQDGTPTHALPAHLMAIHSISFSPDKKYFVTSSMDKTFKIWATETMKLLKVVDKIRHEGHTSSVNRTVWIDYNQALITCSDDKNIFQWAIDIIEP